jgi:hypothetical protein
VGSSAHCTGGEDGIQAKAPPHLARDGKQDLKPDWLEPCCGSHGFLVCVEFWVLSSSWHLQDLTSVRASEAGRVHCEEGDEKIGPLPRLGLWPRPQSFTVS